MSYPSFRKCKIAAGVFWLFAVLKDTTRMAGTEGREGGSALGGEGGRRASEWRNSGHPVASPVSEALVCGQGPHSVLRGRVRTVLVQKSESEVLVRMLWASGVRRYHRQCEERGV